MRILFAPFARKLRNGNVNAKNYPWPKELVDILEKNGNEVVQIGVDGETQVCNKFITGLDFNGVSQLLGEYDTFVAVDSYLQHHGWLIGRYGAVLFGQSDPLIFGHPGNNNLLKSRSYLRPDQFDMWEGVAQNDEAFFSPEEVVEKMN